ncbi:MAG: hypothetical protein ACRD0U_03605 [Acidimicrobiales bacterium]
MHRRRADQQTILFGVAVEARHRAQAAGDRRSRSAPLLKVAGEALGNLALTRALRLLARAPITDGQSGYRALSRRAAGEAEIVQEYTYAQVLTLDLLPEGFQYAEVPITYSFRPSGDSFVKLVPYLRRVVPAVWRERTT